MDGCQRSIRRLVDFGDRDLMQKLSWQRPPPLPPTLAVWRVCTVVGLYAFAIDHKVE